MVKENLQVVLLTLHTAMSWMSFPNKCLKKINELRTKVPLPNDALAVFLILANAKLDSLITTTAVCEERLSAMGKRGVGRVKPEA